VLCPVTAWQWPDTARPAKSFTVGRCLGAAGLPVTACVSKGGRSTTQAARSSRRERPPSTSRLSHLRHWPRSRMAAAANCTCRPLFLAGKDRVCLPDVVCAATRYLSIENGRVPAALLRQESSLLKHSSGRLTIRVAYSGRLRILLLDERRSDLDCLTVREPEVLERVAQGASNKMIAMELGIASATVATQLEHIYGKLGSARARRPPHSFTPRRRSSVCGRADSSSTACA